MNILFLADLVPYPPSTGIKIRTWNILVQLHRCGHRIHLLCFNHRILVSDQMAMRAARENLLRHCAEVSIFEIPSERNRFARACLALQSLLGSWPYRVQRYKSPEFGEKVARTIANCQIDLIHLDKTELYMYSVPHPDIPAVPTNHNVESQLFSRRSKYETSRPRALFCRIQAERTRTFERFVLNRVPGFITCTECDAEVFRESLGIKTPSIVIENGVDVDYYVPDCRPKDDYILIIGAQCKAATANYDATLYFMADIWPLVRSLDSRIRLRIVGRDPDPAILALDGKEGVKVVGPVPDERPHLGRARILAVPLRVGGGSRLKIVTAMAIGTCVVSTSIGAEGIECRSGESISIADTAEDFARSLVRLYNDSDARKSLEVGGRKLVESRYDWGVIGRKLDGFYRSISRGGGKPRRRDTTAS